MCMVYSIATIPKSICFTLNIENFYELSEKDTIFIRIRKLRKRKNLTAKELGKLIGLTEAGIINYENGYAYPSRAVLLKLKEQLGTDILCDDYSKFVTKNYKSLLKSWRKNSNLTYKNAAKYFGMSERTYYSFENMTYIITKNNFEKYKNKILKAINEGTN